MTINLLLSAYAVPALPFAQPRSNPSPFGRNDNPGTDMVPHPATAQGVWGKTTVSARCALRARGAGCAGKSSSCCKCCRKGFGVTGSAVPVKKSPRTALEVTPSYSQLQRRPNKLMVGVTTQTCNEGSSGNTPVAKLDRVTEQTVKNRNCCPPPNKQQTHNSSDSWRNWF